MRVAIKGTGAWGEGFHSWETLRALLAGSNAETEQVKPKATLIPANERRRAPLAVRMAVDVCSQAIEAAGIDATEAACVFASGLGDTDLTDYMCRELAGERKQLSPTKFHNSVHNAAAGYWTIATGCQQPATAIAALGQSAAAALLEGVIQCNVERRPVILALYDIPTRSVLSGLFANRQAFAAALVITPPDDVEGDNKLICEVVADPEPLWPKLNLPPILEQAYRHNPAAGVLPLLLAIENGHQTNFKLPLSSGTSLHCRMEKRCAPDTPERKECTA